MIAAMTPAAAPGIDVWPKSFTSTINAQPEPGRELGEHGALRIRDLA